MEHLSSLQLIINQIETIPEDAFWELVNLKYLSLFSNHIKVLNENLFTRNVVLISLEAIRNPIEIISEKLFAHNADLTRIGMKATNFTSIKFDFTKLEKIEELDFEGNPCTYASFILKAGNLTIADFQKSIRKTC